MSDSSNHVPRGDGTSDNPGYRAAEVPDPALEPDLDDTSRFSGLSGVS